MSDPQAFRAIYEAHHAQICAYFARRAPRDEVEDLAAETFTVAWRKLPRRLEHPLPWLAPILNGVEHANFFETRATEYSKAATRGNWQDVWESFDRRQKAKAEAANDEGETKDDGDDMFTHAGVAAE